MPYLRNSMTSCQSFLGAMLSLPKVTFVLSLTLENYDADEHEDVVGAFNSTTGGVGESVLDNFTYF